MEQGDRGLSAHQVRDGDADKEGTDNALEHDKAGHTQSVVEADEAEENSGQRQSMA